MNKPHRVLLALSSLAVLAACAAAGTPGAPSPEPRAMQASAADSASAHRAATGFLAAFDSLQYEPFRAYFADDVTMFFPFAQFPSRADGKAAVESVFSRFFEAQRASRAEAGRPMVQGIAPRGLRVQMAGADAAIVTFHLGAESPARRSIVFRRVGADAWKVVHWHASSSPVAPAARPSGS
ncbi:MAG TPA: nuclear transport factor 2 family protein [Longimicrobium sp.]|nr:nuclear transport factor 2 family protein [Longimicrobium sp.]